MLHFRHVGSDVISLLTISHIHACHSYEDDSLNNAAGRRAVELLAAGGGAALKQLVPLLWAFGRQVCGAGMGSDFRSQRSRRAKANKHIYPTYPPS